MKKQRKFCIYCGGPIVKKKEDLCWRDFCSECRCFFYDNPLPVVSAIVDVSRQILLVKRDRVPFKGRWCLPTGFAEAGENIEEAVLRELLEETGIRGRISRLMDVDSYKSRFYGDLLFLTFVVEKIAGKVVAGDDSAQAKFFTIDRIPPLAFRSNRRAVSAYIRSKKDYWAVLDAIEQRKDKSLRVSKRDDSLTRRLIGNLLKNRETMIRQWIDDVSVNPSTVEYHRYKPSVLYGICDQIISQITLWLGDAYAIGHIKNFYIKLGRERKKAGTHISSALSALSLIRKHIWDVALAQGALQKNLGLYTTFELQRRMTVFFDLAAFYITRGYESSKARTSPAQMPPADSSKTRRRDTI
jgi:ADP-ribose pyrophosphatase YjhB (NUDIX family)